MDFLAGDFAFLKRKLGLPEGLALPTDRVLRTGY